MSTPLAPNLPASPRFYVMPAQRLSPGVILLAVLLACGCVPPLLYAFRHSRHAHSSNAGSGALFSGHLALGGDATADDDDHDDPNQVDTIYLGNPGDAPVATRPGSHHTTVHPYIVVQLPRSGDRVGQIPDSPAGHLLFNWLAAFNSKDPNASGEALPGDQAGLAEAQRELRKQTGGFTLLSSKEVQPGVLVFRLHDQTSSATEVLGTLQVRPLSSPAAIASFSLRAITAAQIKAP